MFDSLLVTNGIKKMPPMYFGKPNPKLLWKWIFKLYLEKYNFLLKDPLDILNFVSLHVKYESDTNVHGVGEYWPQNAEDTERWLFEERAEDCDGIAIGVASILHTIGNKNIRLVLGYYGTEPNGEEKYGTNHAYCLLMRPDHPNDPYVLDGVGDEILFEMNKLNDIPAYHTLISASAYSKQVWIHGHWIKKYGG